MLCDTNVHIMTGLIVHDIGTQPKWVDGVTPFCFFAAKRAGLSTHVKREAYCLVALQSVLLALDVALQLQSMS